MNAHSARAAIADAERVSRQHIADMLARYPNLSTAEVAEIVDFLRHGRQLEIGLLTCNQAIRPQLDAFMAEHRRKLSLDAIETAGLVVGLMALLAGCWLLWEMFGPTPV